MKYDAPSIERLGVPEYNLILSRKVSVNSDKAILVRGAYLPVEIFSVFGPKKYNRSPLDNAP